jgi:uncharacterized protein (TIRG00374 family)
MGSLDKASFLKKGLIVFTAVMATAMAGILIWTTKRETWTRFSELRPIFIPLLLGLSILRWFLDGMTLRCVTGKGSHAAFGIGRAAVIRLEGNAVANVFPVFFGIFSTHTYLMHKEKIPWSESAAAAVLRSAMPVLLFLGNIPLLALRRSEPGHGAFFGRFIEAISLPVAAVVVCTVAALFYPNRIKKLVWTLVRLVARIRLFHADRLLVMEERLFHGIDRFSQVVWRYFREKKSRMLIMGLWLGAAFCVDGFIALSILWALGASPPVLQALAVQFLIWPIAYMMPVPGGAGVLDFSYLGFFSLYIPQALSGAAVLLWRMLSTYLPVGAGFYFLVREFRRDSRLREWLQGKKKAPVPAADLHWPS